MADIGDTYYCTSVRNADGSCTGWEIRQPSLRASAPTPRQLQSSLGRIVSRQYDDHEAALHFDPPLREAAVDPALFKDNLMGLGWNAGFQFRPTATTAYVNGRCTRCGGGLGPRSGLPLEVDEITRDAGGAFSPQSNEPPPCRGMPGHLLIVSREFLAALSQEERDTFEARPVRWTKPTAGQFFEMIPHELVPFGVIVGEEVTGWRCGQCDRRAYSNSRVLGTGVHVVCREHLPPRSPRFFFAGSATNVHLCSTRERWRTLVGTSFARKLTSSPLAVVERPQYDPSPTLGTLDEIAEFRREHGLKVPFNPRPRQ